MTRLTDQDLLQAFLDRDGVLAFAYDTDGTITVAKGKGSTLVDSGPGELVGQCAFDAVDHNGPENIDHLRLALAGKKFTAVGRFKDDSVFLEGSFTPVRDQAGSVVEVLGISFDVTPRERALREREALILLGKALAEATDLESRLDRVAHLLLPVLGDYCIIDLDDDDGRLHQTSVAHVDPLIENRLFELQRPYSYDVRPDYLPFRVYRSGESVLHAEVTDGMLATGAHDERELELFRALTPKSCVLLPLLAQGRALGVLTLARSGTLRRYSELDLPLLEEVARRIALTVDNDRLHRKLKTRNT